MDNATITRDQAHHLQRSARGIRAIARLLRADNTDADAGEGWFSPHQREGLLMAQEALASSVYRELERAHGTEPDL